MLAKLFLTGFPSHWSEQKVRDLVLPYGRVVSASIRCSAYGAVALVEMPMLEDTARATKALDRKTVQGHILTAVSDDSVQRQTLEQVFDWLTNRHTPKAS